MWKNILLIGLGFFVSSIHCETGLNLGQNGVEEMANNRRRQIAQINKISNMNEVLYDRDVEAVAIKLSDPCGAFGDTDDNQYFVLDIGKYPTKLDVMLQFASSTRIARIGLMCGDSELYIVDVPNVKHAKSGIPGTACPIGRVNKNGLCAKVKSSNHRDSGRYDSPGERAYKEEDTSRRPSVRFPNEDGSGSGSGSITDSKPLETTTKSISAPSVLMSIFTVIFAFFVN